MPLSHQNPKMHTILWRQPLLARYRDALFVPGSFGSFNYRFSQCPPDSLMLKLRPDIKAASSHKFFCLFALMQRIQPPPSDTSQSISIPSAEHILRGDWLTLHQSSESTGQNWANCDISSKVFWWPQDFYVPVRWGFSTRFLFYLDAL